MQTKSDSPDADYVPLEDNLSPVTKIVFIPIVSIAVSGAQREVDDTVVAELAKSMTLIGLQCPITVRELAGNSTYELVVGLHRLKAAMILKWTDIPALLHDGDEGQACLWQISENLHRKELSVLEQAAHIAKWIELAAIDGQVVPKFGVGRPESVATKAARALPIPGKSDQAKKKVVQRALMIAQIAQAAKEAAQEAGLDDNQAALLDVARQSGAAAQLKKVAEHKAQLSGTEDANDEHKTDNLPPALGPVSPSLSGLIAEGHTFDLAVLTPTPEQIALAGKDYNDPEALEKWLPLHNVMHDKAAIVAIVPLNDAPVIANLMKTVCGFNAAKRPRILLIDRLDGPDVSQAKVLIAAERGRAKFTAPSVDDWFTSNLDSLAMALRLYPTSTSLLRVFAAEEVEGWTSLIGSNSWVEEPSVK